VDKSSHSKLQTTSNIQEIAQTLFREIHQPIINAAKQRAAVAINAEITMLYWQFGDQ
jgi:hypothetical protein